MDCIFCKIAAGEITTYKIYETDNIVSFLDIQPCVQGHTIVVPKKHVETILELSDNEVKDLFVGVRIVTEKIKRALKCDNFNIGINHGSAGGQAIPHLHIHIIPRYFNDGGGSIHTIIRTPSRESIEDVYKNF